VETKTKVVEVKTAPQLQVAAIQQGIRDKAAAENWGKRNRYPIVYFMARKQKVYAEKLRTKVDDTQCPKCYSPDTKPVDNEYGTLQCTGCGEVFTRPATPVA
jgi:ribosomal protein L37AE/L43A